MGAAHVPVEVAATGLLQCEGVAEHVAAELAQAHAPAVRAHLAAGRVEDLLRGGKTERGREPRVSGNGRLGCRFGRDFDASAGAGAGAGAGLVLVLVLVLVPVLDQKAHFVPR